MSMPDASETGCNLCGARDADLLFAKQGYALVRCTGCGLAYIANPPDDAELARVYSAAAGYHDVLRDPASVEYRAMARVADTHLRVVRREAASGALLDVGASTGLFLKAARDAGFVVRGVEFNAASADYARRAFGLDVVTGTLDDVRLAPDSLDIVTMFDVIEHLRDPLDAMRAVFAALRPGGLFVLSTPDIDGLFPRASFAVANLIGHWPHPEPPYHLFQFSKATLAAMLRAGGFVPGRVTDTHMPLSYSFGSAAALARSPKMLAYAALFAPLARLGPLIGRGDWFYMAARKPG